MHYKILFFIFLSFSVCQDTITQITDIFPGGKPKEITIYQISDSANSNFTILPSQRYLYQPDGQLHKYQQFWNNGQKSMEALIQRDKVIERHWDINGFPKDTKKFNKENYDIPSIKNQNIVKNNSSLPSKQIEEIKRDLTTLSLSVRELTNSLNSLNQNSDESNDLEELITKNVNLLNNQISQLQQQITFLNEAINDNSSRLDSSQKVVNDQINRLSNEVTEIKNNLDKGRKKKKRNR